MDTLQEGECMMAEFLLQRHAVARETSTVTEPDIDAMLAAVTRVFPDLAGARFAVAGAGWDCVALDVEDRLIFKFPRNSVAERSLRREASFLVQVRQAVSLPVPEMHIHPGPPLFSEHRKLAGHHLLAEDYEGLPERARADLARTLAQFYAELHRIPVAQMTAVGAEPLKPWCTPATIRGDALPALPAELRRVAETLLAEYEELPPDPLGTTYGFFDGHGWNMAFDHEHHRLNGIYDFADSGIGPLHQEFIYSNFIAPDLTERIVTAYEEVTRCRLDRRRISILTGTHRLSEVAELSRDPEHAEGVLEMFERWASDANAKNPRLAGPG